MAQAILMPSGRPFDSLREHLNRKHGLPFLDHLSRARIDESCPDRNHTWRERIYPPWIALGIFVSQVVSDDHSCDDAFV